MLLQQPDTVIPEIKQVLPDKNEDYSLYKLDSELSLVHNKTFKVGLPCLHPVTDLAAYLI